MRAFIALREKGAGKEKHVVKMTEPTRGLALLKVRHGLAVLGVSPESLAR